MLCNCWPILPEIYISGIYNTVGLKPTVEILFEAASNPVER